MAVLRLHNQYRGLRKESEKLWRKVESWVAESYVADGGEEDGNEGEKVGEGEADPDGGLKLLTKAELTRALKYRESVTGQLASLEKGLREVEAQSTEH